MRLKNSLKNSGISLCTNVIKILFSFFIRRLFLLKLGQEYLGLNGLLLNVISMFSLVELGVGSAIGYSLYKPLSTNNYKEIASKMNFFKTTYRWISLLIVILGAFSYPLVQNIIYKSEGIEKIVINVAYCLFIFDTAVSYLLSYKKILLEADQKGYKLNLINTVFFIIVSSIQGVVLIHYKNFIVFIVIKIVFNFISNCVCFLIVEREYKYLNEYKNEKLKNDEKKKIITNTKALILHKVGDICINSTDNIIIAKYISVSTVGLFSNYMMLVTAAQGIIIQIFSSLTSSIGNLIVSDDRRKTNEVFNVLNFIGFIIFGLMTTVFYISIQNFITIWLGEKYLIDGLFLIIISLNMYITGMRVVTGTVKSAAGFYTQDKYSPLIQAFLNLFFSVYLGKKYGLVGVLLGTLISSMVPNIYRPYVIYRYLLKKSANIYYIYYLKYMLITISSVIISLKILDLIKVENNILFLGLRIGISSFIFLILALVINLKSKEVEYIKKILKR
ncbi:MAG: lipopolysaccharide biosynthesis protein [Fusobacteriaceae bacterium]